MNAPFGIRNPGGLCIDCGELIGGKGGLGRCAKHYKKQRRLEMKAKFVVKLGGKCSKCKGVFPLAVYDFHHLSDNNASLEDIAAEVAKCVLLCANCHRMEHSK